MLASLERLRKNVLAIEHYRVVSPSGKEMHLRCGYLDLSGMTEIKKI